MKLATLVLIVFMAVSGMRILLMVASGDGLSTGCIHGVRADLGLADRVVVKPSPENGGGEYSITDAATLRLLGRSLPRNTRVNKSNGDIATTSYVVVEVYADRDAGEPDREITVIPKMGMFNFNGGQL